MSFTYSTYLQLEKLLSLQTGSQETIHNDELLFVTIHQVAELWFKLFINTLQTVRDYLYDNKLSQATSALKRCRMIVKTLVTQMDVISTLSPMAFNEYRNLLGGSSGLQSFQFREIEFVLGYKREELLNIYEKKSWEYERLALALKEKTVNDALKTFLTTQVTSLYADTLDYQANLIQIYKHEPDIAILLDLLLDIDEGLQEWRYRHVKLVERIIGTKQGTGGTKGLEFLKATLFKPFFPDLWEIRGSL